jgi:copper chaperone
VTRTDHPTDDPGAYTAEYAVAGMTYEHCVASVTEEVGLLDGVTAVAVDLSSGALVVTSEKPVPDADVRSAVEEAGYRVT